MNKSLHYRNGQITPEGWALLALGLIIGAGIVIFVHGLIKLGVFVL